MTNEQELHLATIKATFSVLVDAKYRKGQAEHGGDLLDLGELQLVEMALEEAVDEVVYLLSLREKLTKRNISNT